MARPAAAARAAAGAVALVLALALLAPVADAASKPAVVAKVAKVATPAATTTFSSSSASDGARAAAAAARLGAATPANPAVVPKVEEAQFAMKDWSMFAAAFPRFLGAMPGAIKRGQELAAQPVPLKPTSPTIAGPCVPFRPPAPYKTLQQYAKSVASWPWQKADKMFRDGKFHEGGIGVRGCAAGIIVGDNIWGQLGRITPLGDTWSGKCIDEDSGGKPTTLRNVIFPFGVNRRNWVASRSPGDLMGTARVFAGPSWRDGQPVWSLDYSKSEELYGFDFRDIKDEIRLVEPGFAIGTVYAQGSNDTYTSAFNPSNTTLQLIYFALFQTCASDGNYPTTAIDRVFV